MDNKLVTTDETGRVVRYAQNQGFGFIETPAGELVYFHVRACEREYPHVHVGDEVAFGYGSPEASPESGHEGRPCAVRVSFLGNAALDSLRHDFEQGTVLQGFVKRIGDVYYVKDVATHVFIKLTIFPNEVDTEEVYEGSLNQSRDYQLVRASAHNSLRAVLLNRRFRPGLAQLSEGRVYEADVLCAVAGGYVLLLGELDIKGFLPCKQVFKQTIPLAPETRVQVQLQRATPGFGRLLFALAGASREQFLSPAQLLVRHAELLSALDVGLCVPASVKNVLNFGAFVALDGTLDALLHISHFLPRDARAYSRAEKQAAGNLLAELLPVARVLAVVVTDIDGGRCGVDLDMSVASNVALKAQFTQRHRALLAGALAEG